MIRQSWKDLCFLHFEVPIDELKLYIPDRLEIDTFQDKARIALVPFVMGDVMVRYLPNLPYFSTFNEFNVRTYVRFENKPGVYF